MGKTFMPLLSAADLLGVWCDVATPAYPPSPFVYAIPHFQWRTIRQVEERWLATHLPLLIKPSSKPVQSGWDLFPTLATCLSRDSIPVPRQIPRLSSFILPQAHVRPHGRLNPTVTRSNYYRIFTSRPRPILF